MIQLQSIQNMFDGHSCFLICDGPSFGGVDKKLLHTPGVLTMGVNNAPASFRPDLWVFADSYGKFLESLKADPRILKFVKHCDICHVSAPAVGMDLNTKFNPETYLAESTISWGRDRDSGGIKSVLLLALKILYVLGIKNVYLLGVDFKMVDGAKNYHFDQHTNPERVRSNNNAYGVLTERLTQLKPSFDACGFNVWNCNEQSELDIFPKISLQQAVIDACKDMPDPQRESTEGMYDPNPNADPQRIIRRVIRTTKTERLKVLCVMKSGGDYDADDVLNLKRHVANHLHVDYEFICYSDVPEIADRRLRHDLAGWWSKLELFAETGPCIFFDLDTSLHGSIDGLAALALQDRRHIALMQGWRELKTPVMWNSGVMAWNGDYSYLLREFHKRDDVARSPRGGDQEYISMLLNGHSEVVGLIDEAVRLYSYKWDNCKGKIPADASIICFHGKPRPRTVGAPYWLPPDGAESNTALRVAFSAIYNEKRWKHGDTLSGVGSTIGATKAIRDGIPRLMKRQGFASMLDLPCGDFNWMRKVDLSGIEYVGGDIVEEMIVDNTERHGEKFKVLDLTTSTLPHCDVLLCRDCLVHLPFYLINKAISNIVDSGCRWLLATSYPGQENVDIPIARWRPLDMEAEPFNLRVADMIYERGSGNDKGKMLMLFDLNKRGIKDPGFVSMKIKEIIGAKG